MTTSSLDDRTPSPVIADDLEMIRSDDLDTARGIVFYAIAGLAFWASMTGCLFVWRAISQLAAMAADG